MISIGSTLWLGKAACSDKFWCKQPILLISATRCNCEGGGWEGFGLNDYCQSFSNTFCQSFIGVYWLK